MKRIYLILFGLLLINTYRSQAQCPGGRYLNEIFPTITIDSVVYSDTFALKMDIYQPSGDTLSARPVIILAHGGSFVEGTREDDGTIDSLCVRLAKRGYVTVSIDYRLGNIVDMVLDSTAAVDEVIQAMSDGKAAIRYFVKDAATTNTYKIDTNNIFIGGNSAGAVLYMHVGYVENISYCPADIVTAMNANGGFEGNSGNAGYTTKSRGIIDLAGGLNETSFVTPGGKPSVNAQGTQDSVVPYTCGLALQGAVNVTLCGLGSLEPVYDSNHVYHMSLLFPGAGHVPWQTSLPEFNSVDSIVTLFLYDLICTEVASVNEVNTNTQVNVYPNPAGEQFFINASEPVEEISIYDETGRLVDDIRDINRQTYEVPTTRYPKGIYFLRIRFSNENNSPVVKNVVIE